MKRTERPAPSLRHLIDSPTLSIWENGQAFLITEHRGIHLGDGHYMDRVYRVAKATL